MSGNATHVLMIIDASGSMADLARDVRGGYNEYRAQAVADGQNWRFTVSTFNTDVEPLCTNVPAIDAPIFNSATYRPLGGTALLDAIGLTVRTFQGRVQLREGDKVIVFIHTDGEENSSREWNASGIKALVDECMKAGWEFVFAGTGLDDWSDRDAIGIAHTNSTLNPSTGPGVRSWYKASYKGTQSFEGDILRSAPVATAMQDIIDEESKAVDTSRNPGS